MSATINVNLTPCTCGGPLPRLLTTGPDVHTGGCAATPVLIPCPIPRSVTFTARPGEDNRGRQCVEFDLAHGQTEDDADAMCRCGYPRGDHDALSEAARPIRVSCSISGTMWEESEVTDVDADFNHPINTARQMEIARDRWALVKALVLPGSGVGPLHDGLGTVILRLAAQRDAVFAALSTLAHADAAAGRAHREAFAALDKADVAYSTMTPVGALAADMLAAYVARLIEKVGSLEGGE